MVGKKILDIIYFSLNLLRLVFWPNILSSLGNVLCVLDNCVYSVAVRWNVLYMYIRSIRSVVLFQFAVSLLILWMIYPL